MNMSSTVTIFSVKKSNWWNTVEPPVNGKAPAKRLQQFNTTLLIQYLQAPAKRRQHINAGTVGLNIWNLRACHGAKLLHEPGLGNDYNIIQHPQMLCEKFNHFQIQFEPTAPNMSQRIATRWPNPLNITRQTTLRYVSLKYRDHLAGA